MLNMMVSEIADVLNEKDGLQTIYEKVSEWEQRGFFLGTVWEDPRHLKPSLVKGTLLAGGDGMLFEIVSDLRLLAIANKLYLHPTFSSNEASEFLNQMIALNLDLLWIKETELNRLDSTRETLFANRLLLFITKHYQSPLILEHLIEEMNHLVQQRPIVTNKIEDYLAQVKVLVKEQKEAPLSLQPFMPYIFPSLPLWKEASLSDIKEMAIQYRQTIEQTGLVHDFHVDFLYFLLKEHPHLLEHFLLLDEEAKTTFHAQFTLIISLLNASVTYETKQTLYSVMCLLKRPIWTDELIEHLQRVLTISLKINQTRTSVVSGLLQVLGQPLGLGQGGNPTCQSVRAISYWSQKHPIKLMTMYYELLETGKITMEFEGTLLSSDTLQQRTLLDSVHIDDFSCLMVPHLDAIYLEMLTRASGRHRDPHQWVNAFFYGESVLEEFSDLFSDTHFTTRFYEYYHPFYAPQVNKLLPQPVGITVFDASWQVLGAHAILIQRIEADPNGQIRVYFFNPNNDSLQTWAGNITTSVAGKGEIPGESSLVFEDFIRFLYAFHYEKKIK